MKVIHVKKLFHAIQAERHAPGSAKMFSPGFADPIRGHIRTIDEFVEKYKLKWEFARKGQEILDNTLVVPMSNLHVLPSMPTTP